MNGSSDKNNISSKENTATGVAKDLIGNSVLHRIEVGALPDAEVFHNGK